MTARAFLWRLLMAGVLTGIVPGASSLAGEGGYTPSQQELREVLDDLATGNPSAQTLAAYRSMMTESPRAFIEAAAARDYNPHVFSRISYYSRAAGRNRDVLAPLVRKGLDAPGYPAAVLSAISNCGLGRSCAPCIEKLLAMLEADNNSPARHKWQIDNALVELGVFFPEKVTPPLLLMARNAKDCTDLKGFEEYKRARAAGIIGRIGPPAAAAAAPLAKVGLARPEILNVVGEALGRISEKNPDVMKVLRLNLERAAKQDEFPYEKLRALEPLLRLEPESVEWVDRLLEFPKHPDEGLSGWGVDLLCRLPFAGAARERVAKHMRESLAAKAPKARRLAALWIVECAPGDPDALRVLIDLVPERDGSRSELNAADLSDVFVALGRAGKGAGKAAEKIAAFAENDRTIPEIRLVAQAALHGIDPKRLPFPEEAMRKAMADNRAEAISAGLRLAVNFPEKCESARPALLSCLDHSNDSVVEAAARALCAIGRCSPRVREAVAKHLDSEDKAGRYLLLLKLKRDLAALPEATDEELGLK